MRQPYSAAVDLVVLQDLNENREQDYEEDQPQRKPEHERDEAQRVKQNRNHENRKKKQEELHAYLLISFRNPRTISHVIRPTKPIANTAEA